MSAEIELDAKPLSIGKILSERQRFVVPIYQRTYAWNKIQAQPLFDQIEAKSDELLTTGKVAFSHYMGALLLIPDADPVFGRVQVFNIVDGQQRLTTFHLCFAALRGVAMDYGFARCGLPAFGSGIAQRQHADEDQHLQRYKLEPTAYDRSMFRDLVDLDWRAIQKKFTDAFYKNGKIQPNAPEPLWAYWYFRSEAEEYITERQSLPKRTDYDQDVLRRRLLAISTVLFEHFRLIVITLAADDDAQVIFETLNSGGKPLAGNQYGSQ